jgi:hypothetical protein
MLFWILVGVLTVALVTIGLKDSDDMTTQGVVYGVALMFLLVCFWLWIAH